MTWPSEDPAYSTPPPPPMPYRQGPSGQPTTPQAPPKKSRRGVVIAVLTALVVLGVVTALVVLRYLANQGVGATDLKVGDCIATIPNQDRVAAVPTVACTEPHSGEVYAVLTVPGTDYPGQSTIEQWQNKCPAALQSYVPAPLPANSVKVFVLYPTEDTWGRGDRAVTCIATTADKRTSSLRG